VGINKLIEEMTKKDNPADIESVYKELKKIYNVERSQKS
jgi:hypothetical protein